MTTDAEKIRKRSNEIEKKLRVIQEDISNGISAPVEVDLVSLGNGELIVEVEVPDASTMLNLDGAKYKKIQTETFKLRITPDESFFDVDDNPVVD